MMVITTISSINVKPRSARRLPVTIFGSVESRSVKTRIYVKDVLTAPSRCVRRVLVGTASPLVTAGHRINRNLAEELQLATGRVVGDRHTIDEYLQVRRITFT